MHDIGFDHLHPEPEERARLSETIWSADNVELTTVGVDIGSSTSHLMFARVHLQRLSEALSSRFLVVNREILWRSPILLTPYRSANWIDADNLRTFIAHCYRDAGLTPDDVQSGAVILTGEALKRRNARAIADLFAEESGKFVCASAGHSMEAILAAHGSGAVAYSKRAHKTVLNVDIGGGTTKLALIHEGEVLANAALAVGGRLVAFGDEGELTRIEQPALKIAAAAAVSLEAGGRLDAAQRRRLTQAMANPLISAVHLRPWHDLGKDLALTPPLPRGTSVDVLTFSGGVAEYIYRREKADFNDLGGELATRLVEALRDKRIPYPIYDPGHGIRATVIGASQYSVQVSGNTILIAGKGCLPLRNVPVVHLTHLLDGDIVPEALSEEIERGLASFDLVDGNRAVALAFRWSGDPLHARLHALARGICMGFPKTIAAEAPLILLMDGDIARTLGEILRRELDVRGDIVTIDGVQLKQFDFVDIGKLIEPTHVVPLVIKSLLFSAGSE